MPVGKSFSKTARKRDVPAPKYEQTKKQVSGPVQKNKYHNKRSSARGYHNESGGKNTEVLIPNPICFLIRRVNLITILIFLQLVSELDEEFDLKKSKKRNVAYLLNFHCKPRDGALRTSHYSATRSIVHNTIRDLMITQKHKYNKEQFLQAK